MCKLGRLVSAFVLAITTPPVLAAILTLDAASTVTISESSFDGTPPPPQVLHVSGSLEIETLAGITPAGPATIWIQSATVFPNATPRFPVLFPTIEEHFLGVWFVGQTDGDNVLFSNPSCKLDPYFGIFSLCIVPSFLPGGTLTGSFDGTHLRFAGDFGSFPVNPENFFSSTFYSFTYDVVATINSVPEPSQLFVLGFAILLLFTWFCSRRRVAANLNSGSGS